MKLLSVCVGILLSVLQTVAADPLSGEALFADVTRYAEMGVHRAGTKGDVDTARWFAETLQDLGYDTHLQPWPLRQFFLEEAALTVAGRSIDCFPFWFPNATTSDGVTGNIVPLPEDRTELKDAIAFHRLAETDYKFDVAEVAERAANAGARALVVVIPHPSGEVMAQNAREPYNQKPLPIPAVIAGEKDAEFLSRSAAGKTQATVIIAGEDRPETKAYNVIAELKRGAKWVVVTTPSSGWFQCAGERGPGVALWLGLARWAAAHDSAVSYRFIANSGHELANIGAHRSLEGAPPPEEVLCWLHLGASIATRAWERIETDWRPLPGQSTRRPYEFRPLPRVHDQGHLVGAKELLPVLQAAFANVPGYTPRSGEPIRGELRHFVRAGYTAFGMFGGHQFFHTRRDTPQTTAPEFLEPVARALAETLVAVEGP